MEVIFFPAAHHLLDHFMGVYLFFPEGVGRKRRQIGGLNCFCIGLHLHYYIISIDQWHLESLLAVPLCLRFRDRDFLI